MSTLLAPRKTSTKSSRARVSKKLRSSGGPPVGVVRFCISGSKGPKTRFSPDTLIHELEKGLPFAELDILRTSLGIPMESLAVRVGISRPTLHRRKGQGRLTSDESDRLVRFARLMGMAVQALGTEQDARVWLGSPQHGLGGAIPLDYARTEIGAREVEDLLGRVEYGVFS